MSRQIWIQLLLLVAVGVVTLLLTRSTADARHQAIRRILLVLFAMVAAASVVFPTWVSWVAARVGVGRGTDLILYGLVIAFLSYVASAHRRMNDLSRKITRLTRELALARADGSLEASGGSETSGGSGTGGSPGGTGSGTSNPGSDEPPRSETSGEPR
ncbi:DUF2304 family protein [Salana multivorans]